MIDLPTMEHTHTKKLFVNGRRRVKLREKIDYLMFEIIEIVSLLPFLPSYVVIYIKPKLNINLQLV